jgi:hypothetical protein
MTEETLNDYVNKIQSFNMNEDKRFDAVHIKDAVMAGYNICKSECEKGDLEVAIRICALEKKNEELNKKLLDAETDYDKMFWQKNEIISNAKEIIKKLIEAIHIWDCKNLEQVEAEAEQFLSEVEK